jgi:hypothetical protein
MLSTHVLVHKVCYINCHEYIVIVDFGMVSCKTFVLWNVHRDLINDNVKMISVVHYVTFVYNAVAHNLIT